MIDIDAERAAVVAEARSWLRTPYHHMGRVKCTRDAQGTITDKGGVDCAQSVYLIYRAACPHLVPELPVADASTVYVIAAAASTSTAALIGYY